MQPTTTDPTPHPSAALARAPRKMCIIFKPQVLDMSEIPDVTYVTDSDQIAALQTLLDSFYINTDDRLGDRGFRTIVVQFDLAGTGKEDIELPSVYMLPTAAGLVLAELINYHL